MGAFEKCGKNLAKDIISTIKKNNEKSSYDKTYFCTILKNSKDTSVQVPESETKNLDELKNGEYYVKIFGVYYKVKCDVVDFEIDTDVKVVVPQNNWNRMYIDVAIGGNTTVTGREYERTLYANHWISVFPPQEMPCTQKITIDGITSSMHPIIDVILNQEQSLLAKEQKNQWALVSDAVAYDGYITFRCLDMKPYIDLDIVIKVW